MGARSIGNRSAAVATPQREGVRLADALRASDLSLLCFAPPLALPPRYRVISLFRRWILSSG